MLSIGDGANDVAMIQAADVGIGIAGKEGRQAVNNSDYAITQFRFLTRLLLVHGQVSQYRLGRLIKYSFYKNSCFAGVLFYFQIFNGFSGQTLVDDISAAVYNVIFTSLPILFFSLLDQPCKFETMQRFPRTYNKSRGLSIPIFWKTGVLHVRFRRTTHLPSGHWFMLPMFGWGCWHMYFVWARWDDQTTFAMSTVAYALDECFCRVAQSWLGQ